MKNNRSLYRGYKVKEVGEARTASILADLEEEKAARILAEAQKGGCEEEILDAKEAFNKASKAARLAFDALLKAEGGCI